MKVVNNEGDLLGFYNLIFYINVKNKIPLIATNRYQCTLLLSVHATNLLILLKKKYTRMHF